MDNAVEMENMLLLGSSSRTGMTSPSMPNFFVSLLFSLRDFSSFGQGLFKAAINAMFVANKENSKIKITFLRHMELSFALELDTWSEVAETSEAIDPQTPIAFGMLLVLEGTRQSEATRTGSFKSITALIILETMQ